MAPTTDDLRALLDERTRTASGGPGSRPGGPPHDLTATARMAGVRGRVRRTRARQAVVTAAAAVTVVAGSVSVLGPSPTAAPPAPPAASQPTERRSEQQSDGTLPERSPDGHPLALTATAGTQGPRAVTYTVIPRRADLTFAATCTGSPAVVSRVYINGRFSHDGSCSSDSGWLTRGVADWDDWSVAVGRPMTVEIVLDMEPLVHAIPGAVRRLKDERRTTVTWGLYGDVEVVRPSQPLTEPSPAPFPESDLPLVARGVLTENRRSTSFTLTRELDGYTVVRHCAGVTSGLRLQILVDGEFVLGMGCGSEHQSTSGVDVSADAMPRGSRVTFLLGADDTSNTRPAPGPLDPVVMAFELRRG